MVHLPVSLPSVMRDSQCSLKYEKKSKQSCGQHRITVLGMVIPLCTKGLHTKSLSAVQTFFVWSWKFPLPVSTETRHAGKSSVGNGQVEEGKKSVKSFFLGTLSPNKTQLLQRHHTYIFLPLLLCSSCFTGVLHLTGG